MNVVGLQDAAQVGLIGCAAAHPLDGRFLVAEGLEERIRKLCGIERKFGERTYRFFNFNRIHCGVPTVDVTRSTWAAGTSCRRQASINLSRNSL